MIRFFFGSILILYSYCLFSQDTVYARKVVKKLTSKECFGRGYLKNGQDVAAKYIAAELKNSKAKPLFSGNYFQPFAFNVNTFPSKVSVKLNGKAMKPGLDFILAPESGSLKGKFNLTKKDSVNYVSNDKEFPLSVSLKKKLTFSVATQSVPYCGIDVLKSSVPGELKTAEINIVSKLKTNFISKNICAYIEGEKSDSMMVFCAHYDHLGGMGKETFFPGANDNASGVSVLLNFVKYYSEHQPEYKTVFIFFAGEEAGLLGSRYFVDNNTVELKKIKFLINLDLLGTGDDGIMVVNGAVHTKEFETITRINSEKNLVKEIKKRGKARNSDHYWFSEAGVPCFFIYTLGGVTFYHDVMDKENTLPLTEYVDVFKLIAAFVDSF